MWIKYIFYFKDNYHKYTLTQLEKLSEGFFSTLRPSVSVNVAASIPVIH